MKNSILYCAMVVLFPWNTIAWAGLDAVGYGDILCFDSKWGALFNYDARSGERKIISGYGMGADLTGEGPIWTVRKNVGFGKQRLTSGADGTVYLHDGPTIYAIDPHTGNRRRYEPPGIFTDVFVLPDMVDPDKATVAAWYRPYQSRYRKTYELTRSTGTLKRVTSDLDIPDGSYPYAVGFACLLTYDSHGQVFFPGMRAPTGQLDSGPFVYGSLADPPKQHVPFAEIVYNVNDAYFDKLSNRVLMPGSSSLGYSQIDATGNYDAIRRYDDPEGVLGNMHALYRRRNRLLAIKRGPDRIDTLYEIDPDVPTATALPKGPPVGYGFSAPAQGHLATGQRVVSAADGELVWHDMSTGSIAKVAADCSSTDHVFGETDSSVYFHEAWRHGNFKRYDKLTGETVILRSYGYTPRGAAVSPEGRICYSTRYGVSLGHGLEPGWWRDVEAGTTGEFYACRMNGYSSSTIVRINPDESTDVLFSRLGASIDDTITYDTIKDFAFLPDEDRIYFLTDDTWGLWSAEVGSNHLTLVSGHPAEFTITEQQSWAGSGISWGGDLRLYGIDEGYAYVGDSYHNGVFEVDLATGARELLSAPEAYPWVNLDGLVVYPGALAVSVDIKPGSGENPINLKAQGVLPVAILGSETFDVGEVDQATLELAGSEPQERGKSGNIGAFEDVNGDGFLDLTLRFLIRDLLLEPGATQAVLTGELLDGTIFEGGDSVRLLKAGDANLDGLVDIQDFYILKDHFALGAGWSEGDFNDDGLVDIQDFAALKDQFGTGGGMAPTPEPASAVLLLTGTGLMILRRRRR